MTVTRPRLFAPAFLLAAGLVFPLASNAQTLTKPAVPATAAASTATPVATAMPHRMEDRVEHRITDLHRRLKITTAQETDWTQFATVMRANAQRADAAFADTAPNAGTISAPDQLRMYAKVAAGHAEDVQKLVPAFDKLYGEFTPEQKKAADQVFRDYAEHMRGRGGRG